MKSSDLVGFAGFAKLLASFHFILISVQQAKNITFVFYAPDFVALLYWAFCLAKLAKSFITKHFAKKFYVDSASSNVDSKVVLYTV